MPAAVRAFARLDIEIALADGRQSDAALAIQRGARRLLSIMGAAALPEITLANGRRADILAVHADGTISIVEVKSCLADFRADLKWPFYRDFCDRLFFAVNADFPAHVLPDDAGLIVADRFGGAVLREPTLHPLPAARRKALTLRFARAGALRLHALADPDGAAFLE